MGSKHKKINLTNARLTINLKTYYYEKSKILLVLDMLLILSFL